jgi:RNA-binding protein
MELELSPEYRRKLRAEAHHLDPVVMIGNDGLTPAVLHEIDINLSSHGLIKIRVFSDDREARDALLGRISDELDAAAVQHIGKLLVVYRPLPETEKKRRTAKSQPDKAGTRQRRPAAGTPRAPRGVPRAPGEARRSRLQAQQTTGGTAGAAKSATRKPAGDRSADARGSDRKSGAQGIPGRRRPRSQP